MKKIISIFTILCISLSCMCFPYAEVKEPVKKLEGFDEVLTNYNPAYLDLNNQGMIKVWNKEVKVSDKLEIEINGMLADRYTAVVFYTVKSSNSKLLENLGSNFTVDFEFTRESFLSHGNEGRAGRIRIYEGENEVKMINSIYAKPNPVEDSVSFSINIEDEDTEPTIVSLPFTEDDFVATYCDKNLDINIQKKCADYKLSKLYASSMQTLLFMETHYKVEGHHKEEINLKGCSLSYDNNKLKCFRGGGTRTDEGILLSHYNFSPLKYQADVLVCEYEDKKFEIELKEPIYDRKAK